MAWIGFDYFGMDETNIVTRIVSFFLVLRVRLFSPLLFEQLSLYDSFPFSVQTERDLNFGQDLYFISLP